MANKFNDWYETNRKEYNAKRRARYAKDKTYRTRVTSYTRRYREDNPHRSRRSDGSVDVKHRGKIIDGFRTGAVAKQLNVTAEAIRYLEKQKYIPRPTLKSGGSIRTYAVWQVALIELAFQTRDQFNKGAINKLALKKVLARVKKEWKDGSQSKE